MASKYLVRPELLNALIQAESGWNPNAVSNKGAQGLAQVMPATARDPGFGVTPLRSNNYGEQLRFANDYLGALLDKFNGNEALAVAAYNAGPGAVSKHGGIPPFKETINYVGKIGSMLNPIGEAQAETKPSGNAMTYNEQEKQALKNKPKFTLDEVMAEYGATNQPTKQAFTLDDVMTEYNKPDKTELAFDLPDIVKGIGGQGLQKLQGVSEFGGQLLGNIEQASQKLGLDTVAGKTGAMSEKLGQFAEKFGDASKMMEEGSQSGMGDTGRLIGDVAPYFLLPQTQAAQGAGALAKVAPLLENLGMTYGATYAMTPGDSEKRGDQATQAWIGDVLGRGAGQVIGSAVKGFKPSHEAQVLMNEGVQPTLGQGIEQNILGKGARWLEEGLGSLPGFGWASKHARSRAQNEGLEYLLKQGELSLPPIPGKAPGIEITTGGNVGHDAIKSLKNSAKSAYDSLLHGTQVFPPPSALDNIKTIIDDPKYSITDSEKKSLKQFIDSHVDVLKQNNSANTYKQIINDLWKESNSYAGPLASSSDRIKANALRDVASQIKTQLHNGIGPEKSAYLQQIDESFGKIQTLKSAASSAKAAKDGGNFSPSDLLREIRKADKTMRKDAFSMGEAKMQKESARVHNVLGDTLPNSGTTDRAIASAALTGALWPVMDKVLLGAGVGFAGASRPVQKALLGGYQGQHQLGNVIAEYLNRVGAGIGAGLE